MKIVIFNKNLLLFKYLFDNNDFSFQNMDYTFAELEELYYQILHDIVFF